MTLNAFKPPHVSSKQENNALHFVFLIMCVIMCVGVCNGRSTTVMAREKQSLKKMFDHFRVIFLCGAIVYGAIGGGAGHTDDTVFK